MIRACLAACMAAIVACGSNPPSEGSVQIDALFSVPSSGVSCVRLIASGMRKSVQKDFAVSSGQSTVSLDMHAIPTGTVMFSGNAYAEACGSITSSSIPTWLADDVTVTITPGPPVPVQLNFHANGNAAVAGNFIPDSFLVSTLAGAGGTPGSVDASGTAARFGGPIALAFDGADALYVADWTTTGFATSGMSIRRVSVSTGAVTTLAGSPTQVGNSDGAGGAARFTLLLGISLSGSTLYVADRCAVRAMVTAAPYTVTTLLGTRDGGGSWNCSTSASALGIISDLVVRGPGTAYAADAARATIARISLATTPPAVTVVAGATGLTGTADGSLSAARFLGPVALVFPFSGDDQAFVGDYGSVDGTHLFGLVRSLSQSTDSVTTVAGAEQTGGLSGDGLGPNALFASPRRLVSDGSSIFVADGRTVRRLDLATGAVVTIAGSNHADFVDGEGATARFALVSGIARNDATRAIYVADQGNFAVRVLTP